MSRTFLSLYLLLFIGACQGQPSGFQSATDGKSLLWEISGNGLQQPSYFLGTMHIICPQDAHISAQVLDVISTVDKVYFEIDLDDLTQMFAALKSMEMKDGIVLSDLLSATELKKVKEFFEQNNPLPFAVLEHYKPLLLSSMVAEQSLPCDASNGMELLILQELSKLKKSTYGLETMTYQAGLFDSIPYLEQAKDLVKDVDNAKLGKAGVDSLLLAYRSQDLEMIERLTVEDENGLAGNLDLMLYNRNINWVTQFDSIAATGPTLFAVGAGHLPGAKGVLQLLKSKGYLVRPIKQDITAIKKSL